jgi:hypothetical protein
MLASCSPRQMAQQSRSKFVFVKYSVRISAEAPAILTENFRILSESLQANVGIMHLSDVDRFILNAYEFISHPTAEHYRPTIYIVQKINKKKVYVSYLLFAVHKVIPLLHFQNH